MGQRFIAPSGSESEIYNVFPDTWIGAYYNRIETSKTLSLITHSSTGKDGPLSWRLTLGEMRTVDMHACELNCLPTQL